MAINPATKPPIFILGAARSGTTLLRWALDSHGNISSRSEQNFLGSLVRAFRQEFLNLPSGDLFDVTKIAGLRLSYDFQTDPLEIARRFRALHESFYLDICNRQGKARWADSTHTILDHLAFAIDIIYEHTPMYVVLLRHGLDVAVSVQERFNYTLLQALEYWTEVVQGHLRFASANPDRCLTIRYEQLVANPQKTLDDIFTFLDEPTVRDILQKMFTQDHGPKFGDHKIYNTTGVHSASMDRWKSLSPGVYEDAVQQCSEFRSLMTHLGYRYEA